MTKLIELFLEAVTTFLQSFVSFRNDFKWMYFIQEKINFHYRFVFLSQHIDVKQCFCLLHLLSRVVHKHLCTFIYATTQIPSISFVLSECINRSGFAFIPRKHNPITSAFVWFVSNLWLMLEGRQNMIYFDEKISHFDMAMAIRMNMEKKRWSVASLKFNKVKVISWNVYTALVQYGN